MTLALPIQFFFFLLSILNYVAPEITTRGDSGFSIILMSVTVSSLAISLFFCSIMLLLRRWFAILFFLILLIQPILSVTFGHVLGEEPALWPYLFSNAMMAAPIRLVMIYSHLLLLAIMLGMAILPEENASAPKPAFSDAGAFAMIAFSVPLILIVVFTAFTTSRGDYVENVQGGDRFFMVLGPLVLGLAANVGWVVRNRWLTMLSIFTLLLSFLIAMSGYRSVFVEAALGAFAGYMMRRKIGAPLILGGIIALLIAYYVMSYLAFLRYSGIAIGDVLRGNVPAASWEDISSVSGRAEQLSIFTVYYADSLHKYFGLTYVAAFIRSLPNFIYTSFGDIPRVQDILVTGGPVQFGQVGLNLGAYFYAEAILNFGRLGALVPIAATTAGLLVLEHQKFKTRYLQFVYPSLAMKMAVLALYGSANFTKQTLTLLAIITVFYLIGMSSLPRRMRRLATPRRQKAT